jgi:SPP1 gp7 family putative phage head morphogenesis protein
VPGTTNEEYRDAALRHQIGLRRYTAGLMKRIAALLEEADADLVRQLRERLAKFEGKPIDFTGERWKALITDLRGSRAVVLQAYKEMARGELYSLTTMEAERETTIIKTSVPFDLELAAVAADHLRAIVSARPFQGRLLKDWFAELESNDQRRLISAVQLGMVQGEPVDDIVRRVIGTRANQYADGILSITRRDANAIVRTAVNHVSNSARAAVWDANDDIITARIWSSTLDGRTSPVCRARDGHGSPVGDNELPPGIKPLIPRDARPPAHINCRSTMIAYIDGIGLVGRRPTVVDTRTRAKREVDFRKIAKQSGMSIQDVRAVWARRVVGGVPATTTYQDFLSRQAASFQDEVLGKAKGRLFRSGGLTLDQFVDRAGNELSLGQLAATRPEAFIRAGLDPDAFGP